uniref:hypothetical protein n=1 Tax=Fulvivirga sp. TaxID=1931237 RepID=UPI00404A05E2
MKKRIGILFFLLLASTVVDAQQFYVEAAKTLSSFDYRNTSGNALKDLQPASKNYFAIGVRNKLVEKVHFNFGFSYAGYGAIGHHAPTGSFMEWDLNYLEGNFGLDCEVFKMSRLSVYLKGISSIGLLTDGVQTLNNNVYDLKGHDDFKVPMINGKIGAGYIYQISSDFSVYSQYTYSKSLKIKSISSNEVRTEELIIDGSQFLFGLLFQLK